ncbi:28838_t:CDS:1, partial [Racocetra persica]
FATSKNNYIISEGCNNNIQSFNNKENMLSKSSTFISSPSISSQSSTICKLE